MIREDRDPGFWTGIASHPALAHLLHGRPPEDIALVLDRAVALRAEHGGFLFLPADSFGRAYELHTLFTPEGWGREVFTAAREAFDHIFGRGDLVITHETPHPQSRPPRTFGFSPLGEFTEGAFGPLRLWALTRDAWARSPARRH
jgi:hypothetical protein